MPTYDYRCGACGHEFELFQSMKDSPKRKCPKCAKNALERLIGTGAAVLFKGSGFYQTDYRSESYNKARDADAKPADAKAGEAKSGDSTKPTEASKPADAAKATQAETKPAASSKKPSEPAPRRTSKGAKSSSRE